MHRIPLGAHDLFIGEVLAVQASEEVLDERGRLDYGRARLLAYAGLHYYGLGERLGRNGDWRRGIG
jgi:flavin reductase (DIM6/NTAB) family NADH-FMN oxidoreductase RutF